MTHPIRTTAFSLTLAAAVALTAAVAHAQNGYPNSYPSQQQNTYPNATPQQGYPNQQANPHPDRDRRDGDGDRDHDQVAHNWTTDQILTATVHQAWVLSGQNEDNFFAIVRELAEISARNRNLVLPDDPGAGRRAGQFIKDQAKADHDQLLYDIVDKSVRMTGRPANPESARSH